MEKIELTRTRKKAKKKHIERLYDKKPLIELIVAVLSIPSLILLVILNVRSLTSSPNAKPTPTPVANAVAPGSYYAKPVVRQPLSSSAPVGSQTPCLKNLGPVTIVSPNEGDTVTNNPAEIDISYDDVKYCGAVWSYSVNGGQWSDYNNNSVALYNLPNGSVTFNLRIKSLTSSETATITRNFIYTGQTSVVLPINASNSAH